MMKRILTALIFVTAIVGCTGCVKIESVEQHYDKTLQETDGDKKVTISIRCATVLDNLNNLDEALKKGDYIPSDGVILKETTYCISDGDSVFDLLQKAVIDNQIQMEYQGSSYGSVYIQGINYLYEFSCGPLSGWMYKVNGENCDVGCDQYSLSEGDVVEWLYTCDLGNDIGCSTDKETESVP